MGDPRQYDMMIDRCILCLNDYLNDKGRRKSPAFGV
jgi:hypothetical protein